MRLPQVAQRNAASDKTIKNLGINDVYHLLPITVIPTGMKHPWVRDGCTIPRRATYSQEGSGSKDGNECRASNVAAPSRPACHIQSIFLVLAAAAVLNWDI